MIKVTARVGGGLAGRMRVEPMELTLPEGASVQDALDLLAGMLGSDDVFAPWILVAVNGVRVDAAERAGWALSPGDTVSVVFAMAGGQDP